MLVVRGSWWSFRVGKYSNGPRNVKYEAEPQEPARAMEVKFG